MAKKTGGDKRVPSPSPTTENRVSIDGRRFLLAFEHFIRIDVSSVHFSDDDPHRFLQFLRDRVEQLCIDIAKDYPDLQLTVWPTLFVLSDAESRTSAELGQDRGCFLVGVKGLEDVYAIEEIKQCLSYFQEKIEDSDEYVDMKVAPSISAVLVGKSKVGDLKVDNIMWPQQDATRSIISESKQERDTGYDFLADVSPSQRSQSPEEPISKSKLRPAQDVIARLRWDPSKDAKDHTVVYLDRFTGFQELPLDAWKSDCTEDEFVPQHRITGFKRRSTGEVVWHRELRIDKIFRNE